MRTLWITQTVGEGQPSTLFSMRLSRTGWAVAMCVACAVGAACAAARHLQCRPWLSMQPVQTRLSSLSEGRGTLGKCVFMGVDLRRVTPVFCLFVEQVNYWVFTTPKGYC
jgi:hypothetical protein